MWCFFFLAIKGGGGLANGLSRQRERKGKERKGRERDRGIELAMALPPTDNAPWIRIIYGQILRPVRDKRVVEVGTGMNRLVPGVCGVAQEHAQEMAGAGLCLCRIRSCSCRRTCVVIW